MPQPRHPSITGAPPYHSSPPQTSPHSPTTTLLQAFPFTTLPLSHTPGQNGIPLTPDALQPGLINTPGFTFSDLASPANRPRLTMATYADTYWVHACLAYADVGGECLSTHVAAVRNRLRAIEERVVDGLPVPGFEVGFWQNQGTERRARERYLGTLTTVRIARTVKVWEGKTGARQLGELARVLCAVYDGEAQEGVGEAREMLRELGREVGEDFVGAVLGHGRENALLGAETLFDPVVLGALEDMAEEMKEYLSELEDDSAVEEMDKEGIERTSMFVAKSECLSEVEEECEKEEADDGVKDLERILMVELEGIEPGEQTHVPIQDVSSQHSHLTDGELEAMQEAARTLVKVRHGPWMKAMLNSSKGRSEI